jgi:hypothetical protein
MFASVELGPYGNGSEFKTQGTPEDDLQWVGAAQPKSFKWLDVEPHPTQYFTVCFCLKMG